MVSVAVLAPGLGKTTRAFSGLPDHYQNITSIALRVVENYTLYRKPLLTPDETLLLLQSACDKAQGDRYVKKIKQVDTYVRCPNTDSKVWATDQNQLKSIHTRTRAHLVAECRRTIIKLSRLNYLSKEDLMVKVEELLDRDRFICREATRKVSKPTPPDIRR